MPTTIYDSSQLTKRRAEKAIAGSFLTRMYPPNNLQPQTGYGPLPGIYDSSIMNAVKTGHMTEYTRYPTCVGISPGCPCPELNRSISTSPFIPAIPGAVSGITFTVGSIVISWIAPIGDGPFTYLVTPYLNGIAQTVVTTTSTTYRFTDLQEWQPYTFTVCAMNAGGQGPIIPSTSYFLAPPSGLSTIMNGGTTTDIVPSLKYVINAGLDTMLQYAATVNIGPTRGSRLMYVWTASVAQAWRWVSSQSRITGTHDAWNWSNKAVVPLSDSDSIIWLCNVIDFISPYFVGDKYKSIYNCPAATVTRVKAAGEWDRWATAWQTWYNYRVNDGSIVAATLQPNTTQNPNFGKSIIIDGVTVTDFNSPIPFPSPTHWAALWLKGTGAAAPQKYMTYTWDNVTSTCLTGEQEAYIQATHLPLTGDARDAEVDLVKDITANLTDAEKCCAEFWAGGPGTVSPPLMFIWFWKEYMRSTNPKMADKQNIMYSLLDLAIHLFEGGRVTWRLKAAYMEDRPIQEIRRRYAGQTIQSWNGSVDGAQWMPYQEANFVTPPFADFPSGHSHFSTAFALTMNKWFDSVIIQTPMYYDKQTLICPLFSSNATQAYGTFTISKGKSLIEPGVCPAQAITFNYGTWDEMSDGVLGAGISRLYGGIHCDTANLSSQNIAREVNDLINDPLANPNAWNIQTA